MESKRIMPKMTVMQPTVINVDNTGPVQSVASEEITPVDEEMFMENDCYDTEQGIVLQKIDSFDFDHQNPEGK